MKLNIVNVLNTIENENMSEPMLVAFYAENCNEADILCEYQIECWLRDMMNDQEMRRVEYCVLNNMPVNPHFYEVMPALESYVPSWYSYPHFLNRAV